MVMGVIGWMVLGLIAGYIASTLVNKRGEGLPFNILLGMVGAVVGGWLFNAMRYAGVTGFNLWSLLVAVSRGGCTSVALARPPAFTAARIGIKVSHVKGTSHASNRVYRTRHRCPWRPGVSYGHEDCPSHTSRDSSRDSASIGVSRVRDSTGSSRSLTG
jgi:uncharacterized membrane protein YeaQ/YmgE (transglycosylase-associated protein family)